MAKSISADIWEDGRTGKLLSVAGNIALSDQHETFAKLKGTVFEGESSLYVGARANGDYLTKNSLFWANLSWNQLEELKKLAAKSHRALQYLFVTASLQPPQVRYWLLPSEIIEQHFVERSLDSAGQTCPIHIFYKRGRHVLGSIDITNHARSVQLSSEQTAVLERAGGRTLADVPVARQAVAIGANDNAACYDIPLAAGRHAQLRIERPVSQSDIVRLKGWIDLFTEVLTEDSSVAAAPQSRWLNDQVRAGTSQLDRGETVAGEAAFDRILNRRDTTGA